MKAAIAGAGIGGLAAGLALARAGLEVEICEQAPVISEVGAGIQISPNGMRALDSLGVTDALEATLFEPEAISMRIGQTGRLIFSLPMKGYAERRWGARFCQVHRADLQEVLRAACIEAGVVIRTGAKITGYVRERGGASFYVEDGARVFGDILIGADGLHSVTRAQVAGPDRARFTGNMAWRCVMPLELLGEDAPPPEGCIWAGPGRHAVTTRIRGGNLVNFVGIVEQEERKEEGWSIEGSREAAVQDFAGWVPQVQRILAHAEPINRWALFDRPALSTWSDGPVTLLGDAAHPMLPSMAQGAVQALEDAVILAACLCESDDKLSALAKYETVRRDRTARVQRRSAENLRLFHKSGLSQLSSYLPIWAAARLSPAIIQGRQDWIYRYDPTAVV
ncbi:MAG: FAD-dependent monooxygenase [Litoreibacter sp.]|nr:FAD-dependent monooxygenase [Litoreibacter sp.]